MELTILKEIGDLITICKLMSNLEKTNRKDLILKRKGETRCLREQEKLQKGICLNDNKKKIQLFSENYRYLEYTERRCDNGKEFTAERKAGQARHRTTRM